MKELARPFIFAESPDPPFIEVGDFEAKYQAEIDPWEQSGTTGERAAYYNYSRKRLISRLRTRFNAKACGLEIGSGYGYLSQMLSQSYGISGMDVSETAVKRARELHPGIEFFRGDITAEGFALPDQYHFVILAQCWWYVLHEVKQTLSNCLSCLEPKGIFVLHQAFLKDQKYGRDIADGFEGTLRLLMSFPGLRLVEAHYDDSGLLCYHDGLIMLRKVEGKS